MWVQSSLIILILLAERPPWIKTCIHPTAWLVWFLWDLLISLSNHIEQDFMNEDEYSCGATLYSCLYKWLYMSEALFYPNTSQSLSTKEVELSKLTSHEHITIACLCKTLISDSLFH